MGSNRLRISANHCFARALRVGVAFPGLLIHIVGGDLLTSIWSWQGASGRWYEFDVARARRQWLPMGGVYMFVKPGDYPLMEAHGPVSLFVAQTNSFADALGMHQYWAGAEALGAKEIHLFPVKDPIERQVIELDLLRAQTPILNRDQRKVA